MKRLPIAVVLIVLALVAGNAAAGKVNMPKEGEYEFMFCVVDQAKTMSEGDNVFVSHYRGIGNVTTEPRGKPFDRTSATCYGIFTNLNGQKQGFGVCEVVDLDGDKWWMEYHGNPDGTGGTYTSAHGTGKYAGMTLRGEYRVEFWPTSKDAGYQICNPNRGTYKLM